MEIIGTCRLETMETDSGFRTGEGSPKEESPSSKVGPSNFQNWQFDLASFYQKFSNLLFTAAKTRDPDKTIRKARDRVTARGKSETIKRLEVICNQDFLEKNAFKANSILYCPGRGRRADRGDDRRHLQQPVPLSWALNNGNCEDQDTHQVKDKYKIK